jgi:hypothetical protein
MADPKSAALPLGYTPTKWWRELDSNQRRLCQQIYSLPPLANLGISPKIGADDGTRTRNLLITSQLLYQLSYVGNYGDPDRI